MKWMHGICVVREGTETMDLQRTATEKVLWREDKGMRIEEMGEETDRGEVTWERGAQWHRREGDGSSWLLDKMDI